MDYKYEQEKGSLTVCMPRELDHHQANMLKVQIDDLLSSSNAQTLIMDFKDTAFMDSSGIGVILGRYKSMHYRSGKLVAVHLSDQVDKIFKMSGLHKIVEIL
ncbi:anti-sigma factor antagonist [Lachnospiraceae bacterium ZAX-1]